ncbi:MAG: helix-turn-helix transcriptional regulator [Siphonobacter sp.]
MKTFTTLSLRECEVLYLISLNLTNSEIADQLCISANTVSNHRENIIKKTGIKGRNAILFYAISNKDKLEYLFEKEDNNKN